ncbi:hypothetical protein ADUPG1_012043 [Aduncisulcus paluster]|uniref:Uncharacterized protein n=2 Tax=Aduncisulcus paluster TaxID=2918883 RepID=A0ABQ5JY22_9EUKA|nr:hypothetical protein ADUPG1_012043 [Aduncisulcus paluster]
MRSPSDLDSYSNYDITMAFNSLVVCPFVVPDSGTPYYTNTLSFSDNSSLILINDDPPIYNSQIYWYIQETSGLFDEDDLSMVCYSFVSDSSNTPLAYSEVFESSTGFSIIGGIKSSSFILPNSYQKVSTVWDNVTSESISSFFSASASRPSIDDIVSNPYTYPLPLDSETYISEYYSISHHSYFSAPSSEIDTLSDAFLNSILAECCVYVPRSATLTQDGEVVTGSGLVGETSRECMSSYSSTDFVTFLSSLTLGRGICDSSVEANACGVYVSFLINFTSLDSTKIIDNEIILWFGVEIPIEKTPVMLYIIACVAVLFMIFVIFHSICWMLAKKKYSGSFCCSSKANGDQEMKISQSSPSIILHSQTDSNVIHEESIGYFDFRSIYSLLCHRSYHMAQTDAALPGIEYEYEYYEYEEEEQEEKEEEEEEEEEEEKSKDLDIKDIKFEEEEEERKRKEEEERKRKEEEKKRREEEEERKRKEEEKKRREEEEERKRKEEEERKRKEEEEKKRREEEEERKRKEEEERKRKEEEEKKRREEEEERKRKDEEERKQEEKEIEEMKQKEEEEMGDIDQSFTTLSPVVDGKRVKKRTKKKVKKTIKVRKKVE